jgi:hypothetical protein
VTPILPAAVSTSRVLLLAAGRGVIRWYVVEPVHPSHVKDTLPFASGLSQILGNKCRTHQTPGRQALPPAQPALTLHRGMGDYRGET